MVKNLFLLAILNLWFIQPVLAQRPQTLTLSTPAFAATWDGRVIITPKYIGKDHLYRWDVRVFRSEHLTSASTAKSAELFSKPVILDSDDPDYGNLNILQVNQRMHMALYPEPRRTQNPFPSDIKGQLKQNGEYLTYRFNIVGLAHRSQQYTHPQQRGFFVLSSGRITLKNAYKPIAQVVAAELFDKGKILRTQADAEPFLGFEPSLSLDGRLMIWNGHTQNGRNGFIMYSFNPQPGRHLGWSKARPISDMYWEHGPGSEDELLVEGIKFSDRYPIAKKPLRDDLGRVFAKGEPIPGAYPWLSFDASEIFAATVQNFNGPRRSGYVAMGQLTNYMIRHLDGPINPSRSNVTDKSTNWGHTAEGKELIQAYNKLLGRNAWQRIMATPLGLFPSMWNTQFFKSDSLPLFRQNRTYAFLLSHSKRYVEVSLNEYDDGGYFFYLPMNEALNFNNQAIALDGKSKKTDFEIGFETVKHATNRTPDVSGNFVQARMQGSFFPFEYHKAKVQWQQQRKLLDYTEGVHGNSIYFPASSTLQLNWSEPLQTQLEQAQNLTLSFWLKPLKDLIKPTAIINLSGQLAVHLDSSCVYANFRAKGYKLCQPLSVGEWTQYTIVFNDKPALYLNGKSVGRLYSVEAAVAIVEGLNQIGPSNVKAVDDKALYQVDEFSMSLIARSLKEIQRQNFSKPVKKSPAEYKAAEVELGRKLFFDKNLSSNRKVSCATCHDPKHYFTDNKPRAVGVSGKTLSRNTPSVLNRKFSQFQMWDGRASSLEEQALMPLFNPDEMGLSPQQLMDRLLENPDYVKAFQEVYQAEPEEKFVAQSLAAYQSQLLTLDSPYDRQELTAEQFAGQGVFFKARCTACHSGQMLSDEKLHNVGLELSEANNWGLYDVTKNAKDKGKFKTPSLRNVAKTAPYFHDGHFATLEEVIDFYDRGGDSKENRDFNIQPLGLSQQEKAYLLEFLKALTSEGIPQ